MDGNEVIKRALEKDVWLINVGSQYSTSQRAIEYAEKYEKGVYAAIGLHPIHLIEQSYESEVGKEKVLIKTRAEEFNVGQYRELALHPKVIAIGEIGLDYYRNIDISKYQDVDISKYRNEELKQKQKEIFKKQLGLAYELKKPVIIHCRDAHQDVIEILEEFYKVACPERNEVESRGTIHCFSGNWKEAQKYFDLGFHISFTGLITFVHNWDKVIKNSPLEKLMAETDCPYLTPEPHRGKRNEPLYVEYVVRRIAELKKLSFEEVAKATTKNARNLFNI